MRGAHLIREHCRLKRNVMFVWKLCTGCMQYYEYYRGQKLLENKSFLLYLITVCTHGALFITEAGPMLCDFIILF